MRSKKEDAKVIRDHARALPFIEKYLEDITTSIHRQIPEKRSMRYYNQCPKGCSVNQPMHIACKCDFFHIGDIVREITMTGLYRVVGHIPRVRRGDGSPRVQVVTIKNGNSRRLHTSCMIHYHTANDIEWYSRKYGK